MIRLQPRGDRSVTWAEFVEASLLREYRRTHRVPMAELRTFIDLLREQLGVPYRLAHRKPLSVTAASSYSRRETIRAWTAGGDDVGGGLGSVGINSTVG